MKIYELLSIFIIAAALGIIFRYILGYRRKHFAYVAVNLLIGGAECAISYFFLGADFLKIFLSGLGGIILDFLYTVCKLIFG